MSTAVIELLGRFNALTEEERHDMTVEILRSLPDYGDTPGQEYDPLAAEAWGEMDRKELANAQASI